MKHGGPQEMRHTLGRQRGFTLYEILVVVAIIGILTLMITLAYPTTRETQALRLAEQQFQATMRDALSQALNEERDRDCALFMRNQGRATRICSDIGVHLAGGEMTLFADIHQPDRNAFNPNDDFILSEVSLTGGVRASTPTTFVFEAVPPTVSLIANGSDVTQDPHEVTFKQGDTETVLKVYPYGDVSHE